MAYDSGVQRSIRTGLNEDQQATLARLEQVTEPTDTDRGVLRGLRLMGDESEARRAQAVADRWGSRQ